MDGVELNRLVICTESMPVISVVTPWSGRGRNNSRAVGARNDEQHIESTQLVGFCGLSTELVLFWLGVFTKSPVPPDRGRDLNPLPTGVEIHAENDAIVAAGTACRLRVCKVRFQKWVQVATDLLQNQTQA